MSGEWLEPLLRGLIALALAAIVFAAARVRFRRKESPGAGSDIGLD